MGPGSRWASANVEKRVHSGWRTFGIVLVTILGTLGVGYWVVSTFMFPKEFTPVLLSQQEKLRLEHKLEQLGFNTPSSKDDHEELAPEPYSEEGTSREVHLSEKELNALLANNTDFARTMVIDLSDNLASVKLLIDLDPDLPIFGGKTLKVTSGIEMHLNEENPHVVLKGVSLWGVPLPDAWLGNLKNVDLLKEFGQQGGIWQAINDGIEELTIEEGQLRIKLKP